MDGGAYYGGDAKQEPSDLNGYGDSGSQESRSPLSGLNFLKNINADKKPTKDGQPPKRRGPKPDSKPALTRRQELNRQAQRLHRERKELYIKTLEQELMRIKELYGNSARELRTSAAENRWLKELLAAHRIPFDLNAIPASYVAMSASYDGSTSGSVVDGYARQESGGTHASPSPMSAHQHPPMPQHAHSGAQLPGNRIDYDQIGIDFILALEKPCMQHMQYLVVRSHNPDEQPFHHPMENADDESFDHMSGHALMASCPTYSHIMNKPGEPYPHQMPDMDRSALMKLLDTSHTLAGQGIVGGGELTPVMAWARIRQSDRVQEMTQHDFELVTADLLSKARCFGFGAVLEEFEVRDTLTGLFATKKDLPLRQAIPFHTMPQQQRVVAH